MPKISCNLILRQCSMSPWSLSDLCQINCQWHSTVCDCAFYPHSQSQMLPTSLHELRHWSGGTIMTQHSEEVISILPVSISVHYLRGELVLAQLATGPETLQTAVLPPPHAARKRTRAVFFTGTGLPALPCLLFSVSDFKNLRILFCI